MSEQNDGVICGFMQQKQDSQIYAAETRFADLCSRNKIRGFMQQKQDLRIYAAETRFADLCSRNKNKITASFLKIKIQQKIDRKFVQIDIYLIHELQEIS